MSEVPVSMRKRARSRTPDRPSILFYLFVVALAVSFVYGRRAWLIAHRVPILIGTGIIIFIGIGLFLRRRRLVSTLREIDAMTGHEFERYLVRLFKHLGFEAHHVGGNGSDFGADLIIEKDDIRIAVQAKNYLHGHVGNDAVQQAIAGATYYDCDQAMVVTNAKYTKAAKEQAQGCGRFPVTLWDRNDIRKVIEP